MEADLKKYLKRISDANKPQRIMVNGCINGIFISLGTTLGFTIVIVLAAALVSRIKTLPIIDEILKQTKLDTLINAQLKTIENNSDSVFLEYSNDIYNISFLHPQNISRFSEKRIDNNQNSFLIQFNGTGSLSILKLFVDYENINAFGTSENTSVQKNSGDNALLEVYINWLTLENESFSVPVFKYEYKKDNRTYTFFGISQNKESQQKAQSVFTEIVKSVK